VWPHFGAEAGTGTAQDGEEAGKAEAADLNGSAPTSSSIASSLVPRVVRDAAFASAFFAPRDGAPSAAPSDAPQAIPHPLLARLATPLLYGPDLGRITAKPTLLSLSLRMAGRGVPQPGAGVYLLSDEDAAAWRGTISAFRSRGKGVGSGMGARGGAMTASSSSSSAPADTARKRALDGLLEPPHKWWLGVQEAPVIHPSTSAGPSASARADGGASGHSAAMDGGKQDDAALLAADAIPSRRLVGFVTAGVLDTAIARGVGLACVRAEAVAACVERGNTFAPKAGARHARAGAGGSAARTGGGDVEMDVEDGDEEDGEDEGGEDGEVKAGPPVLMVLVRNPASAHYRPALLMMSQR
jgi:hypothetical protein